MRQVVTSERDGSAPSASSRPDEAAALRTIVTLYGRLSALANERTDLSAVARLLAGAVGAEVAVLSPALELLASAGCEQSGPSVVETLRSRSGRRGLGPVLSAVARTGRAVTLPGSADSGSSAVVAPVTVGDDLAAYVTVLSLGPGFGVDMRLLLSEHAAMVCGVVLGRERVVAAAAGRARRDLVEGVLQGRAHQEGELHRWAGHLGFVEGRTYHVVAARARSEGTRATARAAPAPDTTAVHATIEAFLVRHAPDAIVTVREDEVVAVVPGPTAADALDHVRSLATRCHSSAESRHPETVTEIGIGGPCAEAARIATSYTQARRSLETTQRMTTGGGVVAFAELGVQRLLLKVPDVADLREFASEVLGGMLERDAAGGSEHLRTLSVYFRENCSPRRTALGLHVHPNTVSYRIRRIEELTGLSLEDYHDRLLAQVAVEILVPSAGR